MQWKLKIDVSRSDLNIGLIKLAATKLFKWRYIYLRYGDSSNNRYQLKYVLFHANFCIELLRTTCVSRWFRCAWHHWTRRKLKGWSKLVFLQFILENTQVIDLTWKHSNRETSGLNRRWDHPCTQNKKYSELSYLDASTVDEMCKEPITFNL